VAKKEREMAEKLIDSLSTDFEPSSYRDEYREQLMQLIEDKAEGKEIVAPETEEPEPTKAPDLMAALEESIAAVKGREESSDKSGSAPKSKSKASGSSSKKRKSAAKSSKSKSKSSGRAKAKSK
jgi:DNA end-binding protein Ku